jgi:hypothetical protein
MNVNVYTGLWINDTSLGDPDDDQVDEERDEQNDPVNLAYYRDEDESESDPGNE